MKSNDQVRVVSRDDYDQPAASYLTGDDGIALASWALLDRLTTRGRREQGTAGERRV